MSLGRIDTIDILRGFFIFMIIVDHLELFPSGFDILTGRGLLWMSAAEGFFFLSGMMIGIVRGRKEQKNTMQSVAKKLISRGLLLYIWAIGLTLLFSLFALSLGSDSSIKSGLWQGSTTAMLWNTISLQYVYSWADFLRYYSVYLLLSVPAIFLIRQQKAWIIAVVSVIVWLFGRQYSEFLTWQLLFFAGVIAGWYWQQITTYCSQLPRRITKLHYPLVITSLVLSVLVVFGPLNAWQDSLQPHVLRESMPLFRVIIFALWFSGMYRFVRSHEKAFSRTVGKLLIPFGQHSLYVYILHAFIMFFVHLLLPSSQSIIINFALTASVLAIVWLAINKRFLFAIIPR